MSRLNEPLLRDFLAYAEDPELKYIAAQVEREQNRRHNPLRRHWPRICLVVGWMLFSVWFLLPAINWTGVSTAFSEETTLMWLPLWLLITNALIGDWIWSAITQPSESTR